METVALIYTGLLKSRSGLERAAVPFRPGMTYADIVASADGAREAGLGDAVERGLPDGVLLFCRTETRGLQRILDISAPADSDRRELVLTTSMSGG